MTLRARGGYININYAVKFTQHFARAISVCGNIVGEKRFAKNCLIIYSGGQFSKISNSWLRKVILPFKATPKIGGVSKFCFIISSWISKNIFYLGRIYVLTDWSEGKVTWLPCSFSTGKSRNPASSSDWSWLFFYNIWLIRVTCPPKNR